MVGIIILISNMQSSSSIMFVHYVLSHIVFFSITEIKAEFVRKVEDIEVKEREVAVLEVEVSSDTAEVTWHKVNSSAYRYFCRKPCVVELLYFALLLAV